MKCIYQNITSKHGPLQREREKRKMQPIDIKATEEKARMDGIRNDVVREEAGIQNLL
jgi:hypothetical protein